MTRFRVQLTRVAAKDLDALEEVVREAVVLDLAQLSEVPIDRPPRVKRLKGLPCTDCGPATIGSSTGSTKRWSQFCE